MPSLSTRDNIVGRTQHSATTTGAPERDSSIAGRDLCRGALISMVTRTARESTIGFVRLGDTLKKISEPVSVDVASVYREIGIRSHGKGIFHKKPVTGAALGDKRVFGVQPNCLVLNIVFAWEQAVAITTEAESGMIASHRFPMYRPFGDLDVRYLLHFFKTEKGRNLLAVASPGGAGRNKTLNQDDFEDIEVLAPSLQQQRRIADALDTWDRAIASTDRLISVTRQRKSELVRRLLQEGTVRNTRLGELAEVNPPSPRVPPDATVSFVAMEDVSEDGRLLRHQLRRRSEVGSGYTAFLENDVLVAKITPCFENGKGAHVYGLHGGVGYGSTEFHVVRARDRADASFILHHVTASAFRKNGQRYMTGSAGQRRLPAEFIEDYRIASLSESERQRATRVLDIANSEVDLLITERRRLADQKQGLVQKLLITGDWQIDERHLEGARAHGF